MTPEELRKCAVRVYLAAEAGPADDISRHLREAAAIIEAQETQITALKSGLRDAIEVVRAVKDGKNAFTGNNKSHLYFYWMGI